MENGKWKIENGGTRTTARCVSEGIIRPPQSTAGRIFDIKNTIIPVVADGAAVLGCCQPASDQRERAKRNCAVTQKGSSDTLAHRGRWGCCSWAAFFSPHNYSGNAPLLPFGLDFGVDFRVDPALEFVPIDFGEIGFIGAEGFGAFNIDVLNFVG